MSVERAGAAGARARTGTRVMRIPLLLAASVLAAACMQKSAPAAQADVAGGCLQSGDGRLQADVRGALEANVDWQDAQMTCDGDLRPDGKGLRITIAGPMQGGQQLRFIFGIDLVDTAEGPAQVLPTNLTLLVEGESPQLYATRGDDKCAVENLERTPVQEGVERVSARGYCLGPASDLAGETRVLVPTFSFTALARQGTQQHD